MTVGGPVVVLDDHELFSTTLTIALRAADLRARTLPVADLTAFLSDPGERGGLVLLDLDLGLDPSGRRVHGADLVGRLRALGWSVLVVSGSLETSAIAAAIAAGAVGSVSKSSSFEILLRTILLAAHGEPLMSDRERQEWIDRHRRHLARERELTRRLDRLSRREREVLDLLTEGLRAAGIAERLVVSMPTVRTQIRSILVKLEVGSQLEAVALLRGRSGAGSYP